MKPEIGNRSMRRTACTRLILCQMAVSPIWIPTTPSVIIAFWESAKDPHRDGSDDQCTAQGLEKDGVLDLAESRLLDPDLAIEDFADEVPLLVFGNPRFVFVGIGAAKCVGRLLAHIHGLGRSIISFSEKLPWSKVAMVHAMQDNAHTLPSSDKRRDTDHEADGGKDPPAATGVAESDEDSGDDAAYNSGGAQTSGENNAWPVAVADGPADEVGMGLVTERPLDSSDDGCESTWMCGVGKGVEEGRPLFGREVKLARRAVSDVGSDDTGDFLAKRLYRDCPGN